MTRFDHGYGRLSRAMLFTALLSACTACASSGAGAHTSANAGDAPRAGEPQAGEQSCWRDQDCVLVDDCCGCARGGLRLAVRADKLDAVTERGTSNCAERTCGDQPSQHRSCKATAAHCVGGSCLPAL
jgi:hypothetical protein